MIGRQICLVIVFLCCIRINNGRKKIDTESELMKLKIKMLERKLNKFETKLTKQDFALKKIARQSGKISTYCKLLPNEICGPCSCIDDYEAESKYYCDCQHLEAKRDCLQHYKDGNRVSGIYVVTMNNLKNMQTYCDQNTDNGGWMVIQRRIDGTINFYRDWRAYKVGFGNLHKEFWLGNDNIHIATIQASYPKGSELRIDMEDWDNNRIYAKYSKFKVDDENSKYTLHINGYSGNAGDSLKSFDNMHFSTYDRDNDITPNDCSTLLRGAWWYKRCHDSNLNGEYRWFDEKQPGLARGVIWPSYKGHKYSLKTVEIKMRRIE